MSRNPIGIFGGTFDPPHIGHLILASEAVRQLGLSRLFWILAPDPPHKQDQIITPLPHRLEMLKRTVVDNPIFEISYLEINRPGPHYTIDTVHLLAEQQPDADITLLLGGDSLRDLPNWRLPTDLVTAVSKIGVMRRPGDSFDMSTLEARVPGLTAKTHFIDALLQNISSSEIRRRVTEGDIYRYYVMPSVYDYIESNHLYAPLP
ncbi:MAG: nicotinate (nicotinamide) nucleotide adenylyltransferase [Chloroflexi bacterium]|nr:nicotinate (nicotinamide) nucleotide adenylyltransferase [Chloroflexota bacterium]